MHKQSRFVLQHTYAFLMFLRIKLFILEPFDTQRTSYSMVHIIHKRDTSKNNNCRGNPGINTTTSHLCFLYATVAND
jgi:hypothetical protein